LPDPRPDDARTAGSAPKGGSYGWRRRQLVVDARYQLRSGMLVGSVAVVLLVLLNASLFIQHRMQTATAAASVRPLLVGEDRMSFVLLLAGSVVFLGGVFLVGLFESHRTAGASYAIRRAVDAIRDGESEIRIHLRRGDHLQDLARSINQLAETIDRERLGRR